MNANIKTDSSNDIRRVFDLQKADQWNVKRSTAAQRIAKLSHLKDAILANVAAISDALYKDLRRAPIQPTAIEHWGAIADIDDAIAHLDEWMSPIDIEPSARFPGATARITYEARGVCLLFGPWNFPFGLIFQPLVPIIAAGNTVIVKPNELAPATSRLTARIIRETFDEREVAVFEGGVDLANQLLELPFDHIFFTGSPAVGRIVMGAAAKHLASVTLELGGKNPAILDATADIPAVAAILAVSRAENGGQICLCPEYVWVPNAKKVEFIARASDALRATFYVDGQLNKERLAKIVDSRNLTRVSSYLKDAIDRGARVEFGGQIDESDRSVHPTILTNVPADAKMMQEENFGPLLVVFGYDDVEEAIRYVQKRPKALAMYIFSEDREFVERLLASTSSGGVTVNNTFLHCAESRLPFGGVNESGTGRYHGIHGFKELSHERSVFVSPSTLSLSNAVEKK